MLNVAFQCPFPFLFFLQKTSSLVFKKPRLDTGNEQSKGRSKRLFGVLMGTLQERASESKTIVVRFFNSSFSKVEKDCVIISSLSSFLGFEARGYQHQAGGEGTQDLASGLWFLRFLNTFLLFFSSSSLFS